MRKKSWNLVYILAKECRISSFNLTIFRFWFLVRIWYFHWNISIQTFRIPPKLLDFQVKSTLLEFWLENQKKSLEFFREFFHKLIFLLTQRCWGTFKDCLQVKRASALSNCIFNIFVRILTWYHRGVIRTRLTNICRPLMLRNTWIFYSTKRTPRVVF